VDGNGIPTDYELVSCYPNPFNPELNLVIGVPNIDEVYLGVFDLLGHQVADLSLGRVNPGYHRVTWRPESLASGIYILQISSAGGWQTQQRVTFLK
jgi:hypothetical protein